MPPGLFERWFPRRAPVEDCVWTDAAACTAGVRTRIARELGADAAILVLARSTTDREDLARDLAAHAPQVGGDRFAAQELQPQLRAPRALALACVDDLRPSAAIAGSAAPLQVHVLGRGARRQDDRALLALLANWRPERIVFHHSLDDALLRPHAASLLPLLEKLGWRPDQPIASPLLARAIERAQRP